MMERAKNLLAHLPNEKMAVQKDLLALLGLQVIQEAVKERQKLEGAALKSSEQAQNLHLARKLTDKRKEQIYFL